MVSRKTARQASTQEPKTPFKNPLPVPNKNLLLIGVLLLLAGLIYWFRGLFIAAVVNGQPISRLAVIRELEKRSGKQTIDSLVTKRLVLQEASKRKISVSDQEINDEMKKVEQNISAQGQSLNQLLIAQGMSREDFREQIMLQQLLEKMFSRQIQVSETEINTYIETNRDSIPPEASESAMRQSAQQQLQQQKLNEQVQALLEKLKKDANIQYFVNYP